MTRITNLAANNQLVGFLLRTQQRLNETEVQVSSEKVSQTYSGIALESQRLVNLENTKTQLERYVRNNDAFNIRLDLVNTAIATRATDSGELQAGIEKSLKEFKRSLVDFEQRGVRDQQSVKDLQDLAFSTLKDMENYLNIEVDGRYLFAGGRATTEPVDLGLTTLAAFQAKFDGARVLVPTTRDAHLEDFSFNRDVSTQRTDWLTFERDGTGTGTSRVTASNAQFTNVTVGATITITGTNNNNGTYTVEAIGGGGTTLDIRTEQLTDEGPTAAPTLTDINGNVLDFGDFGTLTFNRAANTITAATPAAVANINVGEIITIAGSTDNDGSYTVAANAGGVLTITEKRFTDEGTVGAPFFSSTSGAGQITFNDNAPNSDTIVGPAGFFTGLVAGMQVAVSGSTANNGNVTIASVSADGTTLTVNEALTDSGGADPLAVTFTTQLAGGTIAATPYYQGDELTLTHRVDDDRQFSFGINAADAAFEKAIRAVAHIAQGAFGSEGGLDQNLSRLGESLYLLNSSLVTSPSGTPPFGTELSSNLEQIQRDIGFNQLLIHETNETHERFIGFLDQQISEVENVDTLDAITRLLDDSRALEASYQALARIRDLTLVDFVR